MRITTSSIYRTEIIGYLGGGIMYSFPQMHCIYILGGGRQLKLISLQDNLMVQSH